MAVVRRHDAVKLLRQHAEKMKNGDDAAGGHFPTVYLLQWCATLLPPPLSPAMMIHPLLTFSFMFAGLPRMPNVLWLTPHASRLMADCFPLTPNLCHGWGWYPRYPRYPMYSIQRIQWFLVAKVVTNVPPFLH